MENKKNMVIIVVFSLLAIITVIGFTMYTEEKQRTIRQQLLQQMMKIFIQILK